MAFPNPSPPSSPPPELSSGPVMATKKTSRQTMADGTPTTQTRQRRMLADLGARKPEDWQRIYNRIVRFRSPVPEGNVPRRFTSRYVRKRPNGTSDVYDCVVATAPNTTVNSSDNFAAHAPFPPAIPSMKANDAAAGGGGQVPNSTVPTPAWGETDMNLRHSLDYDSEEDDIYDSLDSLMH